MKNLFVNLLKSHSGVFFAPWVLLFVLTGIIPAISFSQSTSSPKKQSHSHQHGKGSLELTLEKNTLNGKIDPITGKKIKSAKFIEGSDSYFSPDENQYEPADPDIFSIVFEDNTTNTVYYEDLFYNYEEEVLEFYDQIKYYDRTIGNYIDKNKQYEQDA